MQLSHKLARGFISLPAYYRLLNQRLLHHHECLSRLNRKDFHRRALALGLDDPLKTDYSAGNDMKKVRAANRNSVVHPNDFNGADTPTRWSNCYLPCV